MLITFAVCQRKRRVSRNSLIKKIENLRSRKSLSAIREETLGEVVAALDFWVFRYFRREFGEKRTVSLWRLGDADTFSLCSRLPLSACSCPLALPLAPDCLLSFASFVWHLHLVAPVLTVNDRPLTRP